MLGAEKEGLNLMKIWNNSIKTKFYYLKGKKQKGQNATQSR